MRMLCFTAIFWFFGSLTVWAEAIGTSIVNAARSQVGVTVIYDPAYVGLDFPMGDVDISRGVCSDVVIRALRVAADMDLQQLVHGDMKQAFHAYPTTWGLKRPDKNIDHRRVLNLRRYFERHHQALEISDDPTAYLPGDIVSWLLPGNLTHIGVISDRKWAGVPLVIHNIGAGTQEEDILFRFEITGHYRVQQE